MVIPDHVQAREIAVDYTGYGIYAGFWARFAGAAIDAGIFAVVAFVASRIVAILFGHNPVYRLFAHELACILYITYATLQTAGLQQSTIGQRIMGIYVASEDGGKPDAQQAFARAMVQLILIIPVTLVVRDAIIRPSLLHCIFFLLSFGAWAFPFLQINLTPEKTGLYDLIARTRVVIGKLSPEDGQQAHDDMLTLQQHAASQKRSMPDYKYAGLLLRCRARLVDTFLVVAVTIIFFIAYLGNLEQIHNEGVWFQYHMYLLLYGCYEMAAFASPWRATLGKHLMNIQVVNADGQPLSMQESFERYLALLLSSTPLLLFEFASIHPWSVPIFLVLSTPFLPILFTKQKTAMHDLLAQTRVVEDI